MEERRNMSKHKALTGAIAALASVATLGALAAPALAADTTYSPNGKPVAELAQHGGAQRIEIDAAVRAGGDVHHLIAAHCCGGRVGAVGGVGHDDLRAVKIAAVGVIGLDEQNARELTVRARRGLERDSVHAEDLAKLSA